jgi:hypothetical protein
MEAGLTDRVWDLSELIGASWVQAWCFSRYGKLSSCITHADFPLCKRSQLVQAEGSKYRAMDGIS